MQTGREKNNNFDRLEKNRKIGLFVLIFLAFLVVLFWFWQFEKKVYEPFYPKKLTSAPSSLCASGNCQNENDLNQRDTDGDGLNDWDELNYYYTSPYLEDTDGDGLSDKDEIDQDLDPNCFLGQDCYNSDLLLNQESSNNEVVSIDLPESTSLEPEYVGSPDSWEAVLGGEADTQAIRQALLDFGADPSFLRQISDENLMTTYRSLSIEAGFLETATSTEE